mgnify:CR=1 FL=1
MTSVLKQRAVVKTNSVKGSVCTITVEPVTFAKLWDGYPAGHPYVDAKGNTPAGFENQCAIKVSVALHAVGLEMRSFKGGTVFVNGKRAATGAEELAAWLKKQPFCGLPSKPESIAGGDWQAKIKGRTGIIFFANYWERKTDAKGRASGDHIDLWNGWLLTASSVGSAAATFVRFVLGRSTGPDISDLGKATEILFWEIK